MVCPWCYIGKRRFETALAKFSHASEVEVVFHAFELDPTSEQIHKHNHVEYLTNKFRIARSQATHMIARVTQMAAEAGLDYQLEKARGGNSFDAHRVSQLASVQGKQHALVERFMRGYFCEGASIGDHDTLTKLAVEAGLAEAEVQDVLATNRFADDVRDDEAAAGEIGVTGVPFFVLGGKLAISGAQPVEVMLGALDRAWSMTAPASSQHDQHAKPER
jgi:predicted DsbA family dithiol-disulfide isomerase